MVALETVRASNLKLQTFPTTLVALFVGATSGIGESTLKTFYQRATRPRVYFVGRNEEAGHRILSELRTLQPDGEANFIQKDLSLLKNVDEVCGEIKAREKKVNLVFITAGMMSMKGRNETSEGLDKKMTTNYYARMRFTQQLLPLLHAASSELSRVVSVLAPGEERTSFDLENLDLKKNFTLANAANHCITMTDFAFEEFAKQNPAVSFVHAFPGYVKTGFSKESGTLVKSGFWLLSQVLRPMFTGIEESGERHLYIATSRAYPAKSGSESGVELGAETVKKGSTGQVGSGAYLIGADCEVRANEKVLGELRQKGAGEKIWDHLMSTFNSVRGQVSVAHFADSRSLHPSTASTSQKFPNNVALRNQHLPIFPSTPHHDNGIQLSLADGLELRKQSYVKTTCRYTLDYRLLHNYDHSGAPYKLRSDSMGALMAYINSTLPRRLREVLDYQPAKYNHRADVRRVGVPNPIAESHT